MLILSQSKKLTTESMCLSIENFSEIMVQENCGNLYRLGNYDTQERAKEVLQEIIKAYNGKNTYFEMPEK